MSTGGGIANRFSIKYPTHSYSVISAQIDNKYHWVKAADGEIPEGAFIGGHDNTADTIYVARASYLTDVTPGKLVAKHRFANIPYNGEEILRSEYEVLVGGDSKLQWKACSGSYIPHGAIPGGTTRNGEILYVGRVRHEGSVTPGKVLQSKGTCYIPFGGKEHAYTNYEILILKKVM